MRFLTEILPPALPGRCSPAIPVFTHSSCSGWLTGCGGIAFAGWNTDWSFLFLGVILFIAVLVNTYIGRRAQGARK